ncbi:NAD-dependent epimerase/dehydratase family protein [Eubacteriales bacterium OttesenSCG-928-N14]|nr:NAD-dependent epimerase/dehydratase family protein [Eubacteriales bacterium OttesenSCG-928-N14]
MDILVVGGTRFFGIHLVHALLAAGHRVSIATRGNTPDPFGDSVERIQMDRSSQSSVKQALYGRQFDVVCDNIAHCSNDVRYLLDAVQTGRYVATSTVSVYPTLHLDLHEDEVNPLSHPLIWCDDVAFAYDEAKRQMECAIFQQYAHIPSAAVRLPWVIGVDDYTNRFAFYVQHILAGQPMYVDNAGAQLSFVHSADAGAFLAHLSAQPFCGTVNMASHGTISLQQVFDYVQTQTGKAPVLDEDGDAGPYNGAPDFSLNLQRCASTGFAISPLDAWIYSLIDALIERHR